MQTQLMLNAVDESLGTKRNFFEVLAHSVFEVEVMLDVGYYTCDSSPSGLHYVDFLLIALHI
jgi:hypothetical protein